MRFISFLQHIKDLFLVLQKILVNTRLEHHDYLGLGIVVESKYPTQYTRYRQWQHNNGNIRMWSIDIVILECGQFIIILTMYLFIFAALRNACNRINECNSRKSRSTLSLASTKHTTPVSANNSRSSNRSHSSHHSDNSASDHSALSSSQSGSSPSSNSSKSYVSTHSSHSGSMSTHSSHSGSRSHSDHSQGTARTAHTLGGQSVCSAVSISSIDTEVLDVQSRLRFRDNMPSFQLATPTRHMIYSGPLQQVHDRGTTNVSI